LQREVCSVDLPQTRTNEILSPQRHACR
jgi:hypothetical protein